jgi:hypothetical protein
MIEPTEAEKASVAARQKLADIERARLVAAMAICPGGKRYARWVLVDKSKTLPDQITYCADYGDGRGWQPSVQNIERMEDHPGFTTTGGFHYKPMRWNHCFNFIGEVGGTYRPRTAEQLAALRHTRETKAREKLAADMPLLATEIREQRFAVLTKNKVRTRRREQIRQARGNVQSELFTEEALA